MDKVVSLGKLTGIAIAGEHSLALTWDDGHTATVALASLIAIRKSLAVLANPAIFAQAMLSDDGWSVEWPQGIDFGTAQLRRWADEQSREAMAL